MRIALVITELDPGGAEQCLVHLACFLHARGHQVKVLALGTPPRENRGKLVQRLDEAGVEWICGNATSVWHALRSVQWLRRELASFSPDIVQSMLFHANVTTSAAARNRGYRLFGGVRVRQPQRIRWWLQRWASRHLERLICVSQDVARHCREIEGIAADKLVVIPNGIELASPEPDKQLHWGQLQIPDDARVLLFVGRLDDQKGVEPLVAGADAFLGNLPDHHLVLMGDGPLAGRLAAIRNNLPCRARVHLVPWRPDAMDWMRQCEVLVLPARYEGMPNVILEAMSVAKPVVSFAIDGVRELLGSEEAAQTQIVPPRDFPAFARAIETLATDAQLRDACAQHNRLRIEQAFQLRQQLARYEELYLRAVQG